MMAGSGGPPPGRVTLRDIAAEAGVAVSTASRVLTRARDGIDPQSDAGRRVVEVASSWEYERDLFAASLRTRRTLLLGVLVPRLTDVVLSTIYEGLESAAAELAYQTVVANTHDDPHEQRRRAEALLSRRVDGLVLGDAREGDPFLAELAERDVPFVLVSRRQTLCHSVTCDDVEGGRLIANHLADLGHRRIGIIAGEPYASTGTDRTHGCVTALAERGIEVPDERIVRSTFDAHGGRTAARTLMGGDEPPTAIFAVNDITAIGAMGAVRDLGLEVGVDVAIAGFNDISIAGDLPLPLTSVRSPMHEMGAEAARLLVRLIRARESHQPEEETAAPIDLRLPPRLVVRGTTDPTVLARQTR